MHLLNSQDANLDFEPFSPIFQKQAFKIHQKYSLSDSLDWLDNNFNGFKHLSFHLQEYKNIEILQRYKVVYLYRKDLIKCAISLALARATKVYKKTAMPIDYYEKTYELNPDVVLDIAKQARQHLSYVKNLNNSHIVSYEDLFENEYSKDSCIRSIMAFCELPVIDESKVNYFLQSFHKLNVDIQKQVKNYDEIIDCIANKVYK